MAVRSGNRYAPPLRASPVTAQPRRWMAVGPANTLELEGSVSPERSFAILLDVAVAATRPQALSADTQTRVWQFASVNLDLAIHATRPLSAMADTAVRTTDAFAAIHDAAVRVTRLIIMAADLRQNIGQPVRVNTEIRQRIYAVLRREDHLILT